MEEVEVDLDDATILFLAKKAHEKDITLNQYVNEIIKAYIDQFDVDNFEIEDQIENHLVEAHNLYIKLSVQHSSDLPEWVCSLHELQKLLMIRKARRDYPDRYPIKVSK